MSGPGEWTQTAPGVWERGPIDEDAARALMADRLAGHTLTIPAPCVRGGECPSQDYWTGCRRPAEPVPDT